MTKAQQAQAAWKKRPFPRGDEPHRHGCDCQGCHCSQCNRELYWSANARCYSCRSSDCPPGTEAKERRFDRDLTGTLKVLDNRPLEGLTVRDLRLILAACECRDLDMRVYASEENLKKLKGLLKGVVSSV